MRPNLNGDGFVDRTRLLKCRELVFQIESKAHQLWRDFPDPSADEALELNLMIDAIRAVRRSLYDRSP